MKAVLASRDETDPELETELLKAIVDAEADSAGDADAAMHAIDAALTDAIKRGVGYIHEEDTMETTPNDVNGDSEDQEDEA